MVLAATCWAAQSGKNQAARRQVCPPVFLNAEGCEETLLLWLVRRQMPKA
jgi:hypothetical protein